MTNSDSSKNAFDNPLDTKISASTRFAIEVAAWVAGPWAAAELAGNWLVTIPVLAILVALPGVFSTTGDKRHVVVAVPGRVRLFIEILLAAVAIYSALVVWTYVGAIVVAVIVLAMFVAGAPRARWLFSNEPAHWPLPSNRDQMN